MTLETSPVASLKKLWWVCVNLIMAILRLCLRCLRDAAKKVAPNDYGVRCKGNRGGIFAAFVASACMQPVTARKDADTDSVVATDAATDKTSWTNMQIITLVGVVVAFVVAVCSSTSACYLVHWKEGKDQARHDAVAAMKKKDDELEEKIRNLELNHDAVAAMKKKDDELELNQRNLELNQRNLELNQRNLESDMRQMRLSNVPKTPSKERHSFFDTESGLARSLRGNDGSALPTNARQWETQVADPITIVVHRTSRNESEASESDDQLCDSERYKFF